MPQSDHPDPVAAPRFAHTGPDLPPPGGPAVTHVLYLHGFRSSPQSAKAQRMAQVVAARAGVHWWCPQLPPSPALAAALIRDGVRDWPRDAMAVIGSSLGGFYATWLAQQYGCRAVLINPAIDPARDLQRYIGELTAWHDPNERFFFAPTYVDELRALYTGAAARPQDWLALIAQGDEVLDWREMQQRYAGCRVRIIHGSDHALLDFDDHLGLIDAHLGWSAEPLV